MILNLSASPWSVLLITLVAVVPMLVARVRSVQHFWWVFAINVASILGFGWLWFVALALAILDRKDEVLA